jgi:3-deoxy-7-phosphoheptulonate synthase
VIVIIRADAGEEQVQAIVARVVALGLSYHLSRGAERVVLILGGGDPAQAEHELASLPGVDQVLPITRPYRLASREVHPQDTIVQIEGLPIGGDNPIVLAGSASPVADAAIVAKAAGLRDAGANIVRAGVYRPASGLFGTPQIEPEALQRLDGVRRETGLPVAVEVLAAEDVPAIARHADLLVVGAEQMHARPLLQACGWSNRAVLSQRAESAQVQEWLQTADLLLAGGNRQVILCEQGIRTYEPATRYTLDLSAVPLVRRVSHLPIFVDPCYGSGQRGLVESLSLAAVAAGVHGLVLEVRGLGPASGESEGAIDLAELKQIVNRARALVAALHAPART